ncbi:hypothetical protein Pint_27894 [Pistacia integerrima]|uniref:Uncharacterized protein n=1 Tax=Pistacia integerrima TaxID=434235 RepID=A0ACC0YTI8_9ROSI|nr:hypothetical protein Pint_27894 [Pistacia integerrima]
MKRWGNLGVVETIYEEEHEYSSCTSSPSPSPSPTLSSSPATLRSRVEAWSMAQGRKTDVLIRVQGTSFHLHKDPLTSRSVYLKRQLTDLSDLTLSPPLNITAQTFSLIADFCYGAHLVLTPFNVAALRTAAELLQMTETNDDDEDLREITEAYFCRVVTINREYALIVFRSCLSLLPEAETAAFLVSRCIDALSLTDEGYSMVNLFDDVVTLHAEDFEIVAESMSLRLSGHDVLYEIVDLYFKEHSGKLTEEQKTHICCYIDCNKFSSQLLLHAVQNPRMPLRFIIRAMLTEQLNTRRSIVSASYNHNSHRHHQYSRDPITLGAILQRDAALREAAQLKAAMNATSSRIQNLENELDGMKKLLIETEKERSELTEMNKLLVEPAEKERCVLVSGRSASFHHVTENSKIERGERGSVSSLNIRFSDGREEGRALGSLSFEGSRNGNPRMKKNISLRLIAGLKRTFRVSKHGSDKNKISKRVEGDKAGDIEDDGDEMKKLWL